MSLLERLAPTSTVRRTHLQGWPANCSISPDGGLMLGARRLDRLAEIWGTPLFVLDEATTRRGLDDITQARGLRPLFNTAGAMSATMTKWSVQSGWDMWGPADSLPRAWARGVPPHRTVLDLRCSGVQPEEPPDGVRIAVSAADLHADTPRWLATRTVFVGIDGASAANLAEASRWLATAAQPGGLRVVVTLNPTESPEHAAQRMNDCLPPLAADGARVIQEMILDAASHPQPMPTVRALHTALRRTFGRSELEPGVLVDLTRSLLSHTTLALATVTRVRHDPAGSTVEIDAPIRPQDLGHGQAPVRLASRIASGNPMPMELRCRGVSLGIPLLPVDVRQGDLLAIAGPNRVLGACLVIGAEAFCPDIPLAEENIVSLVSHPGRARSEPN